MAERDDTLLAGLAAVGASTILVGDVRERLRDLPEKSVQCVVTSPPYYQLRDYGTASWDGGAAECDHRAPSRFDYALNPGLGPTGVQTQASNAGSNGVAQYRDVCGKCGARRVDRQIGLEQTPAQFIETLVAVFREVRRVMRDDAVLFVNLGDSYAGSGKGPSGSNGIGDQERRQGFVGAAAAFDNGRAPGSRGPSIPGFRQKSLMLIPERFAIAMTDDGWICRSQIVWAKKSAMPESVRDRPTSAWEPIFMFVKQPRYYWDADAVRQPGTGSGKPKFGVGTKGGPSFSESPRWQMSDAEAGANIRNVWHLGPEPSRDEHYAAYPTEIPRRCILAATSEKGQCPACGAPWRRVVEREQSGRTFPGVGLGIDDRKAFGKGGSGGYVQTATLGWEPGCACDAGDPVPQTVLDPFLGSGTTLLVASRLGRRGVGIELNPTYAEMARRRITNDAPLFADVEVAS